MTTLRKTLVPASAVLLFIVGCSDGGFSLNYYEPRPVVHSRPVRAHITHVCTHDCHDHYWDGRRVVTLHGRHRHSSHCGHHWDGSRWIVSAKISKGHKSGHVKTRKARRHIHTHGAHCGCAYDRHGHKWIVVHEGHVHGPNCGHVRVQGRWSIRF